MGLVQKWNHQGGFLGTRDFWARAIYRYRVFEARPRGNTPNIHFETYISTILSLAGKNSRPFFGGRTIFQDKPTYVYVWIEFLLHNSIFTFFAWTCTDAAAHLLRVVYLWAPLRSYLTWAGNLTCESVRCAMNARMPNEVQSSSKEDALLVVLFELTGGFLDSNHQADASGSGAWFLHFSQEARSGVAATPMRSTSPAVLPVKTQEVAAITFANGGVPSGGSMM